MKTLLALDLGTQLGWAFLRADGRIESGSESFHVRSSETAGGRFLRYRAWLARRQADLLPDRIAYEIIRRHEGVNAAHAYGGFKAILEMQSEQHHVRLQQFEVGAIKKHFTGIGNATKAQMTARAKQLGFSPADDNEADAIAILYAAAGIDVRLPAMKTAPRAKKARMSEGVAGLPF